MLHNPKDLDIEGIPILPCSLEAAAMRYILKYESVEGTPILRCSLEVAAKHYTLKH
jgi:hypothetical protein